MISKAPDLYLCCDRNRVCVIVRGREEAIEWTRNLDYCTPAVYVCVAGCRRFLGVTPPRNTITNLEIPEVLYSSDGESEDTLQANVYRGLVIRRGEFETCYGLEQVLGFTCDITIDVPLPDVLYAEHLRKRELVDDN